MIDRNDQLRVLITADGGGAAGTEPVSVGHLVKQTWPTDGLILQNQIIIGLIKLHLKDKARARRLRGADASSRRRRRPITRSLG